MWYLSILRGVAALLAALFVLTRPGWYSGFGVYLLADGLLCSAFLLCGAGSGMLPFLVSAAAGVMAGALSLYSPVPRLHLESKPLAAWALILGFTTLGVGITLLSERQVHWWRPRRKAADECWWPLAAAGLAALALAVLLLLPEGKGPLELRPLLGLFAATFGYLQLRAVLSLGAAGNVARP
jgi:hypothetical protein